MIEAFVGTQITGVYWPNHIPVGHWGLLAHALISARVRGVVLVTG